MQAQRLMSVARGEVRLEMVELGEPGPGEALVRNLITAVSPGTERAGCLGLPNTGQRWPGRLGYTGVSEVVSVGPGVALKPGARLLTREGHASAEVVRLNRTWPAPDGASDEDAAFHRILRIALQGVRKARVELGEEVLVMGGGLIGLLAAQFAYANGAGQVLVADLSAVRRAFAEKLTGIASVDPRSTAGRSAIQACGVAGGPQVVIEATGAPEAVVQSLQFAGLMGRVVLLGGSRGETERVNFYRDVQMKGVTVIPAHNSIRPQIGDRANGDPDAMLRWPVGVDDHPGLFTSASDNRAAYGLMASGRLTLGPLMTHRSRGADFRQVYEPLLAGDERLVGAVLRWG
ncbi:MAG: zinc-binding alcohol dehydrogenase [Actinobacteria bacterium]|nr:zinc-binding alcohol dehydrogenase [Actinomycetota bacterium]